jgi:hypothetical protein
MIEFLAELATCYITITGLVVAITLLLDLSDDLTPQGLVKITLFWPILAVKYIYRTLVEIIKK